jgi:uncharacterized protein YigE (DUF2233 family)
LEPGLFLGILDSPAQSEMGDSRITILRFDPSLYESDIYCDSYYGGTRRTPSEWAEEFSLIAVINAGMYAQDKSTAVGFLKSNDHLNNPRLNRRFNCVFACGALEKGIPFAQIIDLRCEDFGGWRDKYSSFTQSIRMISCQQKNVWQQQSKRWSIAALGMDKTGQILFIHCRSLYSVHDFINILLGLPIDIFNAMYLEGGAEASLYVKAGGMEINLTGISETEILLGERNGAYRPVPNVIGIRPR